jgi:hypothetical protein
VYKIGRIPFGVVAGLPVYANFLSHCR